MLVREILKQKGDAVVTLPSATVVADAVRIMTDRRIGAVVVSDDGRTVDGILSERDLIHSLARDGAEVCARPIGTLMTRPVVTASLDTSVDAVLNTMTERRFRHMPVLENGALAGLISIGDAVKARMTDLESEALQLKEYIGGR